MDGLVQTADGSRQSHRREPARTRRQIVSGKNRVVSDGPFAESKEAIGGYFLLDVASFDDALAIAQECPGLPYGVQVEVRPVAAECPLTSELSMRRSRERITRSTPRMCFMAHYADGFVIPLPKNHSM